MYYPRILVVSNNSFSKTDSNGRTLGNLFLGWPKECLGQFCISTDGPDFDLCNNYYCITDKEVLNSFLHCKKAEGKKLEPTPNKTICGSRGSGKKNLFMMLARNMIWGMRRWESASFKKWIHDFNPELVLLLFSDSSFILKIGTTLSKELNVPLVMFNTEGYYFFKTNYCRNNTMFDSLLFPIYQGLYRKQVRKTMNAVAYSIYLNELLQTDYDKEFGGPSSVLYTSSSLDFKEHSFNSIMPVFSYIGNLTFDRPKALMEVADTLQSISPSYKLDIYGTPLDKTVESVLLNHPGINLNGFISYEEVIKVIRNSDILFHAETKDKRWEEGLKYGFSTKIADSISSGSCFVLYAPSSIACSQYIQSTQAGWYAENIEELRNIVEDILNNKVKRKEVLNNAKKTASLNHNQNNNCQIFRQIIINCVKNN